MLNSLSVAVTVPQAQALARVCVACDRLKALCVVELATAVGAYPCESFQFKVYLLFVLLPSLVSAPQRSLLRASSSALSEDRRPRSLKLNHVKIVEWHEVAVAAEDVHKALGVLNRAVAVACCGLPALNKAKFTLMCVLCGVMAVCIVETSCSLSLLVVDLKALVGILDDERVAHRNRSR